MSVTPLPSSPNQVSIDDIRVKLNEIIIGVNDGSISLSAVKYALLESTDKILLEAGGGVLLENSDVSYDNLTTEGDITITTENDSPIIINDDPLLYQILLTEDQDQFLLENQGETLDLE